MCIRDRNELVISIDFALDNFERKEQLQLSAQVFTQSNEGLILLDNNCNIVMVNKAFTKITGCLLYTSGPVARTAVFIRNGYWSRPCGTPTVSYTHLLCQFSDLHGSSPFSGFQTIFIPVGIAVSESYRKYRIIAS